MISGSDSFLYLATLRKQILTMFFLHSGKILVFDGYKNDILYINMSYITTQNSTINYCFVPKKKQYIFSPMKLQIPPKKQNEVYMQISVKRYSWE